MGILKRNAIVAWQFLRYSCVYKCAYGSCGSLFYWYTTLSCMRERGGEGGVSRKVGGWVQGKMMKEKGRIGKKIRVWVWLWLCVRFGSPSTFSFFFPWPCGASLGNKGGLRDGNWEGWFTFLLSPLHFAYYLLPTTTQSLPPSLPHHEIQVEYF